jgi:hypothetical protein
MNLHRAFKIEQQSRQQSGQPLFLFRCSVAAALVALAPNANALAQSSLYPGPVGQMSAASPAEESFRQVFTIAGYSAAFGAALGASLLPFMPSQSLSNVRYVLGGASLGFVFGTAYGFYAISGAANQQPAYPYDPYDPYGSSYRELGPAERRVVRETLEAESRPGMQFQAFETSF